MEKKNLNLRVHLLEFLMGIFQRFKRYTDWYFNISFILHQTCLDGGIFNGDFFTVS